MRVLVPINGLINLKDDEASSDLVLLVTGTYQVRNG